jgi:hypothetical protein
VFKIGVTEPVLAEMGDQPPPLGIGDFLLADLADETEGVADAGTGSVEFL